MLLNAAQDAVRVCWACVCVHTDCDVNRLFIMFTLYLRQTVKAAGGKNCSQESERVWYIWSCRCVIQQLIQVCSDQVRVAAVGFGTEAVFWSRQLLPGVCVQVLLRNRGALTIWAGVFCFHGRSSWSRLLQFTVWVLAAKMLLSCVCSQTQDHIRVPHWGPESENCPHQGFLTTCVFFHLLRGEQGKLLLPASLRALPVAAVESPAVFFRQPIT